MESGCPRKKARLCREGSHVLVRAEIEDSAQFGERRTEEVRAEDSANLGTTEEVRVEFEERRIQLRLGTYLLT